MAQKMTEIVFKKTIPAGGSGVLTYRIPDACTIERVMVNFYAGQERCLQIVPVAMHGRSFENLVEFVDNGDQFLSGDDDLFSYDISIPMAYDDEIHVRYNNVGSWPYTVDLQFTLDYEAGKERAK